MVSLNEKVISVMGEVVMACCLLHFLKNGHLDGLTRLNDLVGFVFMDAFCAAHVLYSTSLSVHQQLLELHSRCINMFSSDLVYACESVLTLTNFTIIDCKLIV